MLKFAVAYSPMYIGFMMMLMILFSEHHTFNLNFLGVFGKVYRRPNKTASELWNMLLGVGDDDRRV